MNKSDFEKLKDINVFYGAFRVPNHGINLFIFIWGFAPRRQNTFWHCSKKYSKKSRKINRRVIFHICYFCNFSSDENLIIALTKTINAKSDGSASNRYIR